MSRSVLDRIFRLLVVAAFLAAPVTAQAFDLVNTLKGLGQKIERAIGLHDTPAVNAIKPKITFPTGTGSLSPGGLYLVRLACSIAPKDNLDTTGLVVEQTTFVAHSLWFSNEAGDGTIPTNPVKLVNAFSITRDKDGIVTDFENETCSDTFILKGDSDTLTVSPLFADSKTSSPIAKALGSAAKILAGIVPLFMEGPLATTLTGAAKAAGDAADPIKEIIEDFNKSSRKAVTSVPLKVADDPNHPIVVHTAYSDVKLTITPVTDIATQIMENDKLAESFKKVFGAMTSSYATGLTKETAIDRCAGVSIALQYDYKFSANDRAYLLGYFSTLGFPGSPDTRLTCIGRQSLAQIILDKKFDYNEVDQGFNQDDVNTHNWEQLRVKLNPFTAHGYLERLSHLFPVYAQTGTASSKSSLLTWIGPSDIQLDDATGLISPNDSASSADFIGLLTVAYKRFGCFIQDAKINPATYDGVMLALPPRPASGDTYKRDELIAMYVYLVGTGKKTPAARLQKVAFTTDPAVIKEAAKEFDGQCYDAKIDITETK